MNFKLFQTAFDLVRANGLHWTALAVAERLISPRLFKGRRVQLEIKRRLPGFNTIRYNYKEWQNYSWAKGGEEWTDSQAWKDALVNDILLKFIKPGGTVLEIGPGAGRWSEVLAPIAEKLILVDLTEKSIEICKQKFRDHRSIDYFISPGSTLSFVASKSVDYVWSYDVFVHISPKDASNYLTELSRVMVKGGIAIIHHPAAGGVHGGFRSSITNEFFLDQLQQNNLTLVQQYDSWGKNLEFNLSKYHDTITVFTT